MTYYSKTDVCQILGISVFTLDKWYNWQRLSLKDAIVEKPYLPKPIKLENTKGRPLRWTQEMIDILADYQAHIIKGRNGIYGKYTNTARYK